MEIINEELFTAFLKRHLKQADFDADAYLEKLIIHWGESGEERFTLRADETRSGAPAAIAFAAKTRYYIRENGQEIPVEDLDEGYDIYRPVLEFLPGEAEPEAEEAQPLPPLSPLELLRYKAGKSLREVSLLSGVSEEELARYEVPGYDMGSIPLATAAAITKALNVHAEALLSCAPAAPRGR